MRKVPKRHDKGSANVFILKILTYNKATIGTNHVPSSVVLHQDRLGVIWAVDSWKASHSISTTKAQ